MGIKINGKLLNQLRFAEGIVLIASDLDHTETINQLNEELQKNYFELLNERLDRLRLK